MKRIRTVWCCGLVLFMAAPVALEARTWTSADGKTLEAEFVSAADGKVVLKRASDRREFTLPLERLSAEDQKWIEEEGARLEAEAKKIQGKYAELVTGDWALAEHGDLPFALYAGTDLDARKSYPLVVSLHGKSSNNENGKQIGFARQFVKSARYEKRPCFVVAPLCYQPFGETGGGWSAKPGGEVIDLVEEMVKELPVDKKRVYVVGYSMGGFGTTHLMAQEPKLFAAGVPGAGVSGAGVAGKLKRKPLWLWHAVDDKVVDVEFSRRFADAFPKSSKTFKYTELETGGHGITQQIFDNEEVHEWLFKQGVEE